MKSIIGQEDTISPDFWEMQRKSQEGNVNHSSWLLASPNDGLLTKAGSASAATATHFDPCRTTPPCSRLSHVCDGVISGR